jgi:hypothetical protein
MLPREFLQRYGRVVYRSVIVRSTAPVLIASNADRYLFGLWGANGAITIVPTGSDAVLTIGPGFNVGSAPLLLAHAIHGSLVNLAWTLTTLAAIVTVVIVEGFAAEVERKPAKHKRSK